MSTTPTRPGTPQDPELRDRYLRDAHVAREAHRAEAARLAAEVPPAHTPAGPIRVVAALVTLALVAVVGVLLVGPMLKQTSASEQALPSDTTHLVVDNAVGDVRVRVAEAGESPRVTGTTEWGLRRPDVSVDSTDGTTTLHATCPRGFITNCSTDWVVVVPAGTSLDISQGVGAVHVEGIEGDVAIESGVGDVEITEATSSRVGVELGVGSALIEAVEPPDHVEASVGVGDLSVRLPDTVDYRIDADAGTGGASNLLGSTPDSERQVVLQTGLGGLSVGPS